MAGFVPAIDFFVNEQTRSLGSNHALSWLSEGMRKKRGGVNGAGSGGDRRHTRNRCGDLEGAEGFGYKVAANYGGQRRGGAEVQGRAGINVYKWDVSSFDACAAGIKQVEADLGPVEVLINNAGITRDSSFTA